MVRADGGAPTRCRPARHVRTVETVVNGVYVHAMAEPQSTRFEMRAPNEWLRKVDEWRRQQPDIPPRAEAIRRLVERGLSQ